jgi:hypothetical protein
MQSEFTKEKPTAGQTKFCWKKMLRKRGAGSIPLASEEWELL